MVDILPGGYCNQIKTSLFFSINVYSHYSTYSNNVYKASKALTHRDYWLDPDDPWIYIAPNELTTWKRMKLRVFGFLDQIKLLLFGLKTTIGIVDMIQRHLERDKQKVL